MDTYKPLRRNEILFREIEDETILYDPEAGLIHVLNTTAGLVWNLCDGVHTPKQIEAHLREAYDVAEGTDLQSDVAKTLQALAELGLLV